MKKIQAVPIWYNGQDVDATLFQVNVSNLNLGVSARLDYTLYSAAPLEDSSPNIQLRYGTLDMSGEDYANWGSDDDYVWEYVANKLNLVIVPPQENN